MLAARYYAPDDLRLDELPEPTPGADEVKLRVLACSMCGTDLKIVTHGAQRVAAPRVLGHEIAGEIAEVGADVSGWRAGDRVQVAAAVGCTTCRDCEQGQSTVCRDLRTFGYDYDGAFAEYLLIPAGVLAADGLHRIPSGVSLAEASLTEPLASTINGQQLVGLRPGDDVVVIGAGPIGCLHARLARSTGAARIYLVDLGRPERLATAAALVDADAAVDAAETDAVDEVMRLTQGAGADVVLVCAPSAAAQEQAVRMAARRGRISLFAGLPQGSPPALLDANLIHYRELRVTGSAGASPAQNAEALALIGARRVTVSDLVTHSFPLAQIHAGLEILRQGTGIKVTIEP